jgi:nucleoside-diphosphate-sugar epimerase
MTRHVVFGTGQVGHPLVTQLVGDGHDVVAVNRNGHSELPGARIVAGDATDPAFTTAVCQGADVVYFCLNAMNYERWSEEFPPLQRGVMAGAARAGARLVVLDNLYAYGPPEGQPLVETMSANPSSAKSATRAAMTEELLAAYAAGQVEVAIGRASDYFGPRTTRSALGETVFAAALTGKTAQVMGNPDQPHSYSYTPDVARGLIALGAGAAVGSPIWHLPVAETRTTRQLIEAVYALAGHRPKVMAAGRTTLRAIGLVKPEMREYLHTLYQFTGPWVVDDSKFRSTFGDLSTSLDQALATTSAWYRHQSALPARGPAHQTPWSTPCRNRTALPPGSPPPLSRRPPLSPSPASRSSARRSTTRRFSTSPPATSSPSTATTRSP